MTDEERNKEIARRQNAWIKQAAARLRYRLGVQLPEPGEIPFDVWTEIQLPKRDTHDEWKELNDAAKA